MGLSSIIFVSFISLALVGGKQKVHQLILAEKEAGVYKVIERAGGVGSRWDLQECSRTPGQGLRLLCHQCLAHSRCSIRMWWVSTCKRVMHQALGLDFIWVFPHLSLPTDRKSLSQPLFTSVDGWLPLYSLHTQQVLSQGTRQWKPNDCWSPHLSFKNQNLNTLEPAQRTRSLLQN